MGQGFPGGRGAVGHRCAGGEGAPLGKPSVMECILRWSGLLGAGAAGLLGFGEKATREKKG